MYFFSLQATRKFNSSETPDKAPQTLFQCIMTTRYIDEHYWPTNHGTSIYHHHVTPAPDQFKLWMDDFFDGVVATSERVKISKVEFTARYVLLPNTKQMILYLCTVSIILYRRIIYWPLATFVLGYVALSPGPGATNERSRGSLLPKRSAFLREEHAEETKSSRKERNMQT